MALTIELDSTLKDFYELNSGGHEEIYLVYTIPTVQVQMTRGIPISSKYAYQDPLSYKDNGIQARIFAQVVPQLFSMIAGKMNLVMFDLDVPGSNDIDPQPRADTMEVLGQLIERQRPLVTYVRNASEVVLPPTAVLAMANPMDCLEHLPAVVPLETHYRALSKRELQLSELPTPPGVVINTQLNADQVQVPHLRAAEVMRMLNVIEQRPLPFVVKLPQALSGQGTFLVRSETDRSETLAVLRPEVDHMLRQLNHSNSHLHPTSLIVQEMLGGSAMAISLFLPSTGDPIMTSCCDQFIDIHGHWDGGHIDYSQQGRLKTEYMPIAKAIGTYMHQLGYHGPLGADIMTAPDGRHVVIDLNTRVTGSHPLGFMKGHLSVARGFNDAAIFFPLFLNASLAEFKSKFSQELDEGRIVIAGWCHESGGESSVTTIILAGENQERLEALAARITALKTPGY